MPSFWEACIQNDGAQIVELAVTLPLLAAMFVGTYDFGQAFNMRQKLVAATREGARFAAGQTTSDLTSTTGTPPSIFAVRDLISNYLVTNKINDCGLAALTTAQHSNWSWTFKATACPGGDFTVTINRGFPYTYNITGLGTGNIPLTVEATQVRLSYPYQWQFTRIVQFLAPGASYGAVTQISIQAVVQNLN